MRDASDIALSTIRYNLSLVTTGVVNTDRTSGISIDNMWLQYAVDDYVNERTFQTYPSIGICEIGKSKIKYQNYGCTQIGASNGDGSYKVYSPLGEKEMMIQIDLWCDTQAIRRQYKSIIENFLLLNKSLTTDCVNDPVTGESIYIEFIDYELSDDKPYTASFFLNVQVGIFQEQDCYIVDEILIRGKVGQELAVDESASGANWILTISGTVSVTGQPDTE